MEVWTAFGLVALALGVGVYGSVIGAGGGFLMVAGLTLVFGLDGAVAVGTSVLTTLFIQASGAVTYSRQGLVDWVSARWFVLGSVPVAFATGAWVADRIPQRSFDLIVGVLLVALAAFVVTVRSPDEEGGSSRPPNRPGLTGSGAVIGVLSGGLGVGAGLVTVPLLTWMQRLSAHRAAATTTATGTIAGLAASTGHSLAGNPQWSYLPMLVLGAVVGGRIGARKAADLAPPSRPGPAGRRPRDRGCALARPRRRGPVLMVSGVAAGR